MQTSFVQARPFLLFTFTGSIHSVEYCAYGAHAQGSISYCVHVHGWLDLTVADAACVNWSLVYLLFQSLRSSRSYKPELKQLKDYEMTHPFNYISQFL